MNHWEMGDEDMAECHEAISEEFFEYIDSNKKEISKASKELHEIIDFSDPLMRSLRAKRGKRLWFPVLFS